MPVLCTRPQEHLTFYQAVSSFQGGNGCHLLFGKPVTVHHCFQIFRIVMCGEGNGHLSVLNGPFQAYRCRMNVMRLRNCQDFRHFHICQILRTDISFRTSRRAKGHISHRLNAVCHQIIKQFLLLEAGMHLDLTGCRFDFHQRKHCLQLGNGHIGDADVADQSFLHQRFALTVGIHEALCGKRFGIRITGIHITSRCVIVRERPVNIIHIHIVTLQICNALFACFGNSLMHIIPYLCHDIQIFSFNNSFLKRRMEHLADVLFVSIACCAVKHTIAAADSACHCLRHLFCADTVRAKGTHADHWHCGTVVQFFLRHSSRINKCHIVSSFFMIYF